MEVMSCRQAGERGDEKAKRGRMMTKRVDARATGS